MRLVDPRRRARPPLPSQAVARLQRCGHPPSLVQRQQPSRACRRRRGRAYWDGAASLRHAAVTKRQSRRPPRRRGYRGTRSLASSSSARCVVPARHSSHVALNTWLVGWVGHPYQPHDSRPLDDDLEKQIELPDERPAADVHPHPRAARVTVRPAVENVDVPDDVRAPAPDGGRPRPARQSSPPEAPLRPPPLLHGTTPRQRDT